MTKFIKWHKRQTEWWMDKFGIDWYGVAWIAFVKGVILTVLFYTFFV